LRTDYFVKGYNLPRRCVLKKYLLVSALGLSVILSSCGWLLKGTKIDLPGDNPVGLNGKTIDVGSSGAGRPELMSNRVAKAFNAAITDATFADTPNISTELNKYGISVGGLTAWGACLKFSGTAVLKNNTAAVPAAITLSDVSAELTLKDAVTAGISFTLKTDPATASLTLNNTSANNYSFDPNKLVLCARLETASLTQLVTILEAGGTNTTSGTLKYSLDGISGLSAGSTLTLTFGIGSSYIIL
jgi:hypothetical protein